MQKMYKLILQQQKKHKMSTKIAIYPGTFDPVTYGHLNIIKRAAHFIADHLIIGIAGTSGKKNLFSLEERLHLMEDGILSLPKHFHDKISVIPFEGLLVHFAMQHKATILIRGLRALSDFEYEFQLASMNRQLEEKLETVFLMTDDNHHFVSSRLVKEIASLGGDIHSFVSPGVIDKMKKKF